METKKTIYDLHEDHKIWLNKLAFYKDDLAIMKNRISEIASKNTSNEVLAQVEHFQNQLIVQKENIDTLHHEIGVHETGLRAEVNKNETAIDHKRFADHTSARAEMESFEKTFNDLRKELIHFLAKWM